MKTTARRRGVIAAMMALALVAAACGSGNGADDTTTTSQPTTTEATTTTVPTTEPGKETTTTTSPPVEQAELVWSLQHEESVHSLAVSPDGVSLVAAAGAGYIHHIADGRLVDVFVYIHFPYDVAFSHDGAVIGAGLGVGGVALTDTAGEIPSGLEGLIQHPDHAGGRLHEGFDSRVAFSPDGEHVATGNRDGIVWLWDLSDGSPVASFEAPGAEYITGLTYDPSGTLLAATHFDCAVNVWDVSTGDVVHALNLNDFACYGEASRFAFSPDGTTMAGPVVEDFVQFLRVWDTASGQAVLDFPMDVRSFADLSYSPDGTMLATAHRGMPPTVWDPATARMLYSLDSGIDPEAFESLYWPTAIEFTMDGGHVVVGYWDGTLELWRLPGAAPLLPPPPVACEPLPLPGDVLFDTGSAALRADASPVLDDLAVTLANGFPVATLTFVGHTDSRGTADANLTLSLARAEAVRDWFADWAEDARIDGWTLLVDGRGDTELRVVDVDTEGNFLTQAGALNRRVEIEIDAPGCG